MHVYMHVYMYAYTCIYLGKTYNLNRQIHVHRIYTEFERTKFERT